MANSDSSLLTKIVSAILVTVTLSGGVWVGTIQTRLAHAEEELDKQDVDHDKLIEVATAQETMKEDIKDIESVNRAILEEIRKLGRQRNAEGDTN